MKKIKIVKKKLKQRHDKNQGCLEKIEQRYSITKIKVVKKKLKIVATKNKVVQEKLNKDITKIKFV